MPRPSRAPASKRWLAAYRRARSCATTSGRCRAATAEYSVAGVTGTTAPAHRHEARGSSYRERRRARASSTSCLQRCAASLADRLRILSCDWALVTNRRASSALTRASSTSSRTSASVTTRMVPPRGLEALRANTATDRTPRWRHPPTRRPRRLKCIAKARAVNTPAPALPGAPRRATPRVGLLQTVS